MESYREGKPRHDGEPRARSNSAWLQRSTSIWFVLIFFLVSWFLDLKSAMIKGYYTLLGAAPWMWEHSRGHSRQNHKFQNGSWRSVASGECLWCAQCRRTFLVGEVSATRRVQCLWYRPPTECTYTLKYPAFLDRKFMSHDGVIKCASVVHIGWHVYYRITLEFYHKSCLSEDDLKIRCGPCRL